MKIAIVSTGHTQFGVLSQDIGTLMFQAAQEALNNAHTTIGKIDAVYIANFSSGFSGQCHLPALLASEFGTNLEAIRVESACASGGLAIKEAALAILSGLYKTVLVIGAEKMTGCSLEMTTRLLASAASPSEIKNGATFPSLYALMAQRHFADFKTTERHLAKVAVKNHANAMLNPLAQFHKKITVEDVMASRMIAAPLKLFDCSPTSDGAAAVLMTTEENAAKYTKKPIHLVGIGHSTDRIGLYERDNLVSMPAVVKAAKRAFAMSGLKPKNVKVAELHDCFTIAELIEMEDLGFCEKGQAKNLIDKGETEINGPLPINPSGGLKAKGHPVGATGVSQVVEIFKQLTLQAGKRQVKNALCGLCCNVGGSGASAVVSLYTK